MGDDKFVRKIELTKADGSTQTVYLGSPAGGQSVHVRLGGQNEVYLGNGLEHVGGRHADLLNWIDPVYLSVNAADVTGLDAQKQERRVRL